MLLASVICQGDGKKKRVNVKGEYLENEEQTGDSATCILSVQEK